MQRVFRRIFSHKISYLVLTIFTVIAVSFVVMDARISAASSGNYDLDLYQSVLGGTTCTQAEVHFNIFGNPFQGDLGTHHYVVNWGNGQRHFRDFATLSVADQGGTFSMNAVHYYTYTTPGTYDVIVDFYDASYRLQDSETVTFVVDTSCSTHTGGGGNTTPPPTGGNTSGGGPSTPPAVTPKARRSVPVQFQTRGGRVLGDEAAPQCPYLTTYLMKKDPMNFLNAEKRENVIRLQTYLNARHNAGLEIDGKYGPATQAAVGELQLKNTEAILGPWHKMNKNRIATENVHAMTKAYINFDMGCEEEDPSWLPGEERYHKLEIEKVNIKTSTL